MKSKAERAAELARLAEKIDHITLMKLWRDATGTPLGGFPDRLSGASCEELVDEILDAEFRVDESTAPKND